MGRNKGYYNKDTERVRQEKKKLLNKYKNPTAMRLKEKVTGALRQDPKGEPDLESRINYIKSYQKHYNACYSDFAKRSFERNYYESYRNALYETYQIILDDIMNLCPRNSNGAPGLAKPNLTWDKSSDPAM